MPFTPDPKDGQGLVDYLNASWYEVLGVRCARLIEIRRKMRSLMPGMKKPGPPASQSTRGAACRTFYCNFPGLSSRSQDRVPRRRRDYEAPSRCGVRQARLLSASSAPNKHPDPPAQQLCDSHEL